jgi:hypothetical protein
MRDGQFLDAMYGYPKSLMIHAFLRGRTAMPFHSAVTMRAGHDECLAVVSCQGALGRKRRRWRQSREHQQYFGQVKPLTNHQRKSSCAAIWIRAKQSGRSNVSCILARTSLPSWRMVRCWCGVFRNRAPLEIGLLASVNLEGGGWNTICSRLHDVWI